MKILALTPRDMTVEPVLTGLESLARHEIIAYRFDSHGVPVDRGMLNAAEMHKPDLIVYIGQNSGPFLASEATFLKLKHICPSVLLCFDGSDKTWTPLLTTYRDHDAFSLVVNIDGCTDWPRREIDFTCLTPTCQEFYV